MNKRKPTQIHTRKLDRLVAHTNMKNRGIKHINRHSHTSYITFTGMTMTSIIPSYFASHWRKSIDYIPTYDFRR